MENIYQKENKRPFYKDLADLISKDILTQNLKNDDFYCTMKSLCRRFNASFITVRNAVSLLEQQEILYCRSAVGLFVRDINRLKIFNSFDRFVLILSSRSLSNTHPFFTTRLMAAMRTLIREGFMPRVCCKGEFNNRDLEVQASLADGIISSYCFHDMIFDANIKIPNIPKVFFSPNEQRSVPQRAANYIFCDFNSQDRLCLNFLRTQSFRKIVYIHKASFELPILLKKEFGNDIEDVSYSVHPSIECGVKTASKILEYPEDTYFIVDDDYVAIGIHTAALPYGRDLIREQRILVTSSPTFELTKEMGFPVIGFDPNKVGTAAAENLIAMIKNPDHICNGAVTASSNENLSADPQSSAEGKQ